MHSHAATGSDVQSAAARSLTCWRTLRAGYTLQNFEGGLLGGIVGSLLTVSFSGFTYQGGSAPGAYAPAIVSPTTVAANDGTTAASIAPALANLSGVRAPTLGTKGGSSLPVSALSNGTSATASMPQPVALSTCVA